MAWQPAPESLRTLIGCLKDSHNGFDLTAQKQAEIMLTQAKSSPDFSNYLACIFSSPAQPEGVSMSGTDYNVVRYAAGIMLKNTVKTSYKQLLEPSVALIKAAVPLGLQDESPQVRSYAGSIATELVRRGGLYAWPELLNDLLAMVGNTTGQVSVAAQEGAMAAMTKICEDNASLLEREQNGQRPLNFLLPKLIEACDSPLPKVRAQALTAINEFVPHKSQAMLVNIDALLQRLFALAPDPSFDVRRQVCRAFVYLVETRADKLQPHLAGLVDYIITQQKDEEDEDLACQAAEFWLSAGEHESFWRSLVPFIPKIIPALLEGIVYSGEDIALYGSASDDEDEDDRQEDIKPQFAKRSGVRKGCAAALDVLSRDFGDAMFECVLPYLTTNLRHADWPQRESAVLALGAVAEGCMNAVRPHLPQLVPYLITLLNDSEPLVRQITCWTLSRYALWAAGLPDPAETTAFFEPMMGGLLLHMLDRNKKVQEAAASAMATLEEQAGKTLEPYAGPIIQQYVQCFEKYKDRNMYILYDCVQTLAEAIGPLLAQPELAGQLIPALFRRYDSVPDESRELFPLLECFSYVAMSLGPVFGPYAQPVFRRCVTIIHQNLEQALAAAANGHVDAPDKDFLVTSLDLISAIIQALAGGGEAGALVADTQPAFFELLGFCMEDPSDEVRQSAYAVLGDCARFVFPQLLPCLADGLLPILVRQLEVDGLLDDEADSGFSVINNACWSAGELAVQLGDGMRPHVDSLLKSFVAILTDPHVPRGVNENAAIALGRLGLGCSEALAPHLHTFADDFLASMDGVDPTDEKATAFKGFTMVVSHNPAAMEKVLLHYFRSIARYQDIALLNPIKQDLHEVFQNILFRYRELIPQFDTFLAQLDPQDVAVLRTSYGV
ncbi:importin beta-2 [Grosmannia clavigera kw1407]|uniref:Importin beta-2 n=1 Tax=Grosmannia clavigera (strain kw1407 / UAMH 11150) TaxID=655863 RepID=F0XLZ1_GROCL|nr:importin beta-2 [Grosmannia clavigera kw1407]EFX01344.1 importin beta-2 [Grosmannia clavigera kw1407]